MTHTASPDWRPSAPLATAAARGGLITAAGTATRFVVQLVTVVLIARLLGPSEYGFAVVVLLLTGLAELLRVGGVGALVTRAPTLTAAATSTLHLLSAGLGVLIAGAFALAAPALGPVLGFPASGGSIGLLAVVFATAGASAVPGALLARNLRFRALAVVEVLAMVAGATTALVLALAGAGSFALVAQALVFATVLTTGTLVVCPWWPTRPAGLRTVRAELGFAANVSLVQLLNFAARNTDKVLVGAAFGPVAAGLYAQAGQLLTIPLEQVNGPLQRVAVPVLAKVAGERARFARYYRSLTALTGYVLWPTFAVLGVLADAVVAVLFGPEWAGSVPIFRILVLAGLAQTLGYVTVWVFVATGQGKRQTTWALISRPLVVASFVIGAPWGVTGMAWASSIGALLLVVPGFVIAGRLPGLTLRDLVVPVVRPGLVALVAGWAALATRQLALGPWLTIAVGCAAAAVAIALAVLVVPGVRRDVVVLAARLRPAPADSDAAADVEPGSGAGVSVVVPVGSVDLALRAQLDALAGQQQAGPVEVVLAANAVDADTLQRFADQTTWPDAWLVRAVDASDVRGPSHARNVGWRAAQYDVVLFCDGDDVVQPGWIPAMAVAVREHGIGGGRLAYDALNLPALAARVTASTTSLPVKFGHLSYSPSCALGVARHLLEAVEGFDETMRCGEDIDFCWRVAAAGAPIVFVPDAVLQYRLRSGARGAFRQAFHYGVDDARLLRAHRAAGARWRVRDSAREWASTGKAVLLAPTGQEARITAATRLGAACGRLQGSVRHRIAAF
ncbi:O-antigen/teichoic acid export membrane protein [Curtobacterium sp. PhB172]|uniref:oligosaccharide flippase family protein n=1 Tax=unclassified Curtobacterium TaxID=257496 RepID=UPI000F47DB5D|nr:MULTISPECIES: oligosaccharide flippase family protein [unclassified Curtobacterium]ROQ17728.1 O-antigen/teichoic acid export membrane protein [Curtobacterium sp. PhB171]ROQ29027.1 O-antigen/teichoic acid export membrane protein [Curtobacterium sp. PhB170]ROS45829.1 O-antigen/teichoic acid export membrane protein [Curtobacterium sp. PhB131]ROS65382.1 O-antigen/teichoic acid export membrane protein [Curtobacterium sp. PhB172]ROS67869.1 O-antigen/teichoic acid export membrane protein [Curtobac